MGGAPVRPSASDEMANLREAKADERTESS